MCISIYFSINSLSNIFPFYNFLLRLSLILHWYFLKLLIKLTKDPLHKITQFISSPSPDPAYQLEAREGKFHTHSMKSWSKHDQAPFVSSAMNLGKDLISNIEWLSFFRIILLFHLFHIQLITTDYSTTACKTISNIYTRCFPIYYHLLNLIFQVFL